jgi:hypothetical protein
MSDLPQAEGNRHNTQANNKKSAPRYTRRVVIYAAIAYLILLGITFFWPNLTERTKFFTANGLTLALLIVAIAQVLIYHRQQVIMQQQWKAIDTQARHMKGQLDIMRDAQKSFAVSERAYLTISDMRLLPMTIGEPFSISLTLHNGGRTPAWHIETAVESIIASALPVDLSPLPPSVMSEDFIPANAGKQTTIVFEIIVTEEYLGAILAGTATFFVRGEVRYRDFANAPQLFVYRTEYDPYAMRFKEYKEKKHDQAANPN